MPKNDRPENKIKWPTSRQLLSVEEEAEVVQMIDDLRYYQSGLTVTAAGHRVQWRWLADGQVEITSIT
jgi:hypothetical protein